MAYRYFFSEVVLVITAMLLFYAAFTDFKQYKIRNDLVLTLVGLFAIHALVSGRWVNLPWNIGLAAVVFLFLLYFYLKNWMGGGDVKLLTVAVLWVGLDCAILFALLLLVFSTIHTLALKLGWFRTQELNEGRPARIPFAPSLAAALISMFMIGCLRPQL